jgi:hypothetical protein
MAVLWNFIEGMAMKTPIATSQVLISRVSDDVRIVFDSYIDGDARIVATRNDQPILRLSIRDADLRRIYTALGEHIGQVDAASPRDRTLQEIAAPMLDEAA